MSGVVAHYGRVRGVLDRITEALTSMGLDPATGIDPAVLAPVDEFHLGGHEATMALTASLGIDTNSHILDVGCGLGGPAREMARTYGCHVLGIDLQPEFVYAAEGLSLMTGMEGDTSFEVGDVTVLDRSDRAFDAATMIHVGMNVPDKPGLFAAIASALRPGGRFGIYDIMRTAGTDAELGFPLPFATDESDSHLASSDDYVAALTGAGLSVVHVIERTDLVGQVIQRAADGPKTPLNLGLVMGSEFPTMFTNLRGAIKGGFVRPIEIVAEK
ncbi:MAG: methyltransferase domain-containing protein [Actinobacteria bacterium]|jgi:MPBQ/MSBQ methyltransferase|nr:methyltransferase domain-containing protein [Actinomycetota bacterium]